jgi:hypothetical protein
VEKYAPRNASETSFRVGNVFLQKLVRKNLQLAISRAKGSSKWREHTMSTHTIKTNILAVPLAAVLSVGCASSGGISSNEKAALMAQLSPQERVAVIMAEQQAAAERRAKVAAIVAAGAQGFARGYNEQRARDYVPTFQMPVIHDQFPPGSVLNPIHIAPNPNQWTPIPTSF